MFTTVYDFTRKTQWADLPTDVQHQSKRCLLDLIGVGAAGSTTKLSAIIRDHAAEQFAHGTGCGARMMFDGRRVSAAGAALAGGMTIDAMDAHDGHPMTKGHAGCGLLPALLAMVKNSQLNLSGAEILTTLVVGYEVAVRAGIALHATANDYHTSGAWVTLGMAAMATRLFNLDEVKSREAFGIAEFHGPRSQMMRVIDDPTMVKDGSGWGAMAGVSAVILAMSGFTGAPAVSVEKSDVASFYSDLGQHWAIQELYFKPYPVCRWAQPPIQALFDLKKSNAFDHTDVSAIRVYTFHNACRLATRQPKTTEQAQYSLPFPLASALVSDRVGPKEVDGDALNNPTVLALSNMVDLIEDEDFEAAFPALRFARIEVDLKDGRQLKSDPSVGTGNAENPLSDVEIQEKFIGLMQDGSFQNQATRISEIVWSLEASNPNQLIDLIMTPAN